MREYRLVRVEGSRVISRNNVLSVLRDVALRVPDRPALVMESGAITFGGLRERIGRAAAGLRRLGLRAGERAIVMIPMSIDLYVAMLALLEMGAVAVFVDPWIGRRQIAAFAAFAEPRAWIGIAKSHLLRLLDPRLRAIPIAVTTGRPPRAAAGAVLAGRAGRRSRETTSDPLRSLRTIPPSSPSPPAPRASPRGPTAPMASCSPSAPPSPPSFRRAEGDVEMTMFPVFALNNLAAGVPSIVPAMDFRRVDRIDAGRVLAQMRRHGVTTCTASPPFFDRLAAAIETGRRAARPPPPAHRRRAGLGRPAPRLAPGLSGDRDPGRLRLHRGRAGRPSHRRGAPRGHESGPPPRLPATARARPSTACARKSCASTPGRSSSERTAGRPGSSPPERSAS